MNKEKMHELVQKMIDQMETSGQWVKNWTFPSGIAKNYSSKKSYKGFNALWLACLANEKGYETPFWLTYKQAKELGGVVRKGEKGTEVFFYSKKEKKGQENVPEEEKDFYPLLKRYVVFNISQTEGIDYQYQLPKANPNQRLDNADSFVQNTKAKIKIGGGNAFYSPIQDFIQIPDIGYFDGSDQYYATLLHELVHWTKHPNRLDREVHKKFGDNIYAYEELIAELGAVFLCSYLGVSIEENRHPEYLKSWISVLRETPQILWGAATKAQQAFDFLVDIVSKNEEQKPIAAGATQVFFDFFEEVA